MRHVVIVGGGVIGLTTAYALRKRGAQVTVVESHAGSHGASVVNAGWICPSLAGPVPAPGLVGQSLKWMLRSDSPLYIKPALDFDYLRWLVGFWRHCNARAYAHALEATTALNQRTFELFDEMQASGVRYEAHKAGILFVFHSLANLDHDLKAIEPLQKYGIRPPTPYGAKDVHALEPSLSDWINGGFWYEGDRHVRPDTLTSGLTDWLKARDVAFRTHTRVIDIEHAHGQARVVNTTDGRIPADAIVIAAGARTGELTKKVGVRLPIQGGKGYCLDYAPPPVPLGRPIDFAESRFVGTPMSGMIRIAGTMEFSGINDIVRQERVAALARGAARAFTGWPEGTGGAMVDSGLRPITPDGLPVIGWLPGFRNLAVASGHAMLGVTLSASTGDAVADLVTTGQAPAVIEPFDPARFT
jgi:D-amino-acid dehydrogenase